MSNKETHATPAPPRRVVPLADQPFWNALDSGTFVVFDKPYHPYFKERTPYVVAVVALEEGPEIMTNVVDTDVSAVEIGMPVHIVISNRGKHRIHQASARV